MAIKVKKILGHYPKGEASKIRVAISNNGKEDYLDIREFTFTKGEKWVPAKGKGIWIPKSAVAGMNQDSILEMAEDIMEEEEGGEQDV